ncbi:TPA: YmiA family putative membrane protein [Serratia liquefaciens]|uniref:YmiA family putative membrane protein n=1 Tax=Serratia liquefaciens TaxID=614 RepID=A0A515CUL7_SERLI|nr:YmiA family putative membrane protein [Serratia liquefaciens]AYO38349.1 YmiA family putative membrane protein [Serratia sp. P2ACOL2]MBI6161911.1 YmiA family putative membrane protein [Serratia liquefaciens]MBV0842204.1 YmiA family putative membrane protein [Serratia liquefaciens]QDL31861.1 YmiA family putative membrane protein [Serratia liquefaciens]QNQ52365.1 YmiA family putative membrane protein [Serratia liquefaciens]
MFGYRDVGVNDKDIRRKAWQAVFMISGLFWLLVGSLVCWLI